MDDLRAALPAASTGPAMMILRRPQARALAGEVLISAVSAFSPSISTIAATLARRNGR